MLNYPGTSWGQVPNLVKVKFDQQKLLAEFRYLSPVPWLHQEVVHLVSTFSDIFTGFQVSRNLETWKPGNPEIYITVYCFLVCHTVELT